MRSVAETTVILDDDVHQASMEAHKRLMEQIVRTGDRAAFKALFVYFGPRIKALMIKAGAEQAVADDLVQDVMMTLWSKAHLYRPDRGAVSTWVYTIARNARIDRLRRRSSQPYDDLDDVELASEEADAEACTLASQQSEGVAIAVADLPEDQRQIIECAFVQDLSQSEIAAKLSLPLGTVKSRMRLAYSKLKRRLEVYQ